MRPLLLVEYLWRHDGQYVPRCGEEEEEGKREELGQTGSADGVGVAATAGGGGDAKSWLSQNREAVA